MKHIFTECLYGQICNALNFIILTNPDLRFGSGFWNISFPMCLHGQVCTMHTNAQIRIWESDPDFETYLSPCVFTDRYAMHLTSLCTQIRIWESSLVYTLCDSIYIIRERKDNVKCDVRKGRIEFFQFWKHFTLSWYIDDRKFSKNVWIM